MKKIIIALTLVFATTISFAQSTAPVAVVTAFNKKFPNASKLKWIKENSREYEASFQWKGVQHSANFSESGEWTETESPINFNQLPDKVQKAFNASNKETQVTAVAKIVTSKGVIIYEVEKKQGAKTIELFYTEDGHEIKK